MSGISYAYALVYYDQLHRNGDHTPRLKLQRDILKRKLTTRRTSAYIAKLLGVTVEQVEYMLTIARQDGANYRTMHTAQFANAPREKKPWVKHQFDDLDLSPRAWRILNKVRCLTSRQAAEYTNKFRDELHMFKAVSNIPGCGAQTAEQITREFRRKYALPNT